MKPSMIHIIYLHECLIFVVNVAKYTSSMDPMGYEIRILSLSLFLYIYIYICIYTFPETNIAPENRPSQKETSIPTIHFQEPC